MLVFSHDIDTLKHQMFKIEEETISHLMGLTNLVDGANTKTHICEGPP